MTSTAGCYITLDSVIFLQPKRCIWLRAMQDVIRKFPARPPTPDERALLDEWVAAAGDIALAYFSSRERDDPTHRHRIVIATDAAIGPSHFIHAPLCRDIWMVFSAGRRTRIKRFRTLRDALNSIRPVLPATVQPGLRAMVIHSSRSRP